MDVPWGRDPEARGVLAALVLVAALTLPGCFGAKTPAANSPSVTSTSSPASPDGAAALPTTSPTAGPTGLPTTRWDAPGSATLTQTLAVARRYAAALHAEKITEGHFHAPSSTWDYWSSGGIHERGIAAIESIYRGATGALDWSKRCHVMAAPGVAVCEGATTNRTEWGSPPPSAPFVTLLAVDGTKLAHVEIFQQSELHPRVHAPVRFCRTAPGPRDTPAVAGRVAATVGDALAGGDTVALRRAVAPDVLFYDTGQAHEVRGWAALVDWWANVPAVELENTKPIAGPGWAVVRWTLHGLSPSGGKQEAFGATVLELRRGKVVRMTLYYDGGNVKLQS